MTDFKEYSAAFYDHQNELMHYGVKGMKWHHYKRRLQEITGIGLKKEESLIRRGGLSAAKNEIEARKTANSPYLNKKTEVHYEDVYGNRKRGTEKDYYNDLATKYKKDRVSAISDANYVKKLYNDSILGKIENTFKKFRKKKRR